MCIYPHLTTGVPLPSFWQVQASHPESQFSIFRDVHQAMQIFPPRSSVSTPVYREVFFLVYFPSSRLFSLVSNMPLVLVLYPSNECFYITSYLFPPVFLHTFSTTPSLIISACSFVIFFDTALSTLTTQRLLGVFLTLCCHLEFLNVYFKWVDCQLCSQCCTTRCF